MQLRGHTRGGNLWLARLTFRWVVSTVTLFLLLFGFTTMVGAQTPSFEIVVPINTVVRAPEGSVTVLNTTETPGDLVGETCRVTAQSENQSSVHPGNDLIVESETSIVLEDVEAQPGGTVTASDNMVLSEQIVISLLMGPDEVFSAGIDVQFDCPPEPTTTSQPSTTTTESTTTTVDKTTTTIVATTITTSTTSTTIASTTSTSEATTTTVSSTTTTAPSTTTTVPATTTMAPSTTSTTVEDEVLAFTGPEDDGLGLIALALAALGSVLLVGERSLAYSPSGRSFVSRRCRQCERDAVFSTPHGGMCLGHTRRALHDDDRLWMPRRLT